MADNKDNFKKDGKITEKSDIALREERIQKFWEDNKIFEKSVEKSAPNGEMFTYDGPPFATGSPHYGHLLAGTIKDVIPRYATMNGKRVKRRWGWDCHGLPIENLIEKELNLKSKKDIEEFGIEKFNDAARASVFRYDKEWKRIVPRTGRWVDMENQYNTMSPLYMESVLWSFKQIYDKDLVYEGFKSMLLCPRCETTLSNFEVSLGGYKDTTDISVYVKFELVDESKTFMLAWTTTPWTLPGNAALAVKSDIKYVKIKINNEFFIVAKDRLSTNALKNLNYEIVDEFLGSELVGKSYIPLFNYYQKMNLKNKENIYKIWAADFVTTEDGTGVVHIAPAFGEDDYNLSVKEKIPFIQHVGTDGRFKNEVVDFAGLFVKPKSTEEEKDAHQKVDIEIIKFLAKIGGLFAKEKIIHPYPHCWRCDTPLLNYASSSWFVKVTDIKEKIISENKKVNWVPEDIRDGRFGKWLEGARDWAISRGRFWGSPIPIWRCSNCDAKKVVGSVQDMKEATRRNKYFVVRHGQAENNVLKIVNSDNSKPCHLTEEGKKQLQKTVKELKKNKIDVIFYSPLIRTKESAKIIAEGIKFDGEIIEDERLKEVQVGEFKNGSDEKYRAFTGNVEERFSKTPKGGENLTDLKKRVGEFIYEIDEKYEGKNILLVTHEYPTWLLVALSQGLDVRGSALLKKPGVDFLENGEVVELDFANISHNRNYELDFHRPYVDEVKFKCGCGGEMKRIPEVFDTWYESGSVPFASNHYPFEEDSKFNPKKGKSFPADFIAEGIDQTRGWFYSLLVLSSALFNKTPYKNVVVNGIVLAEDGQKMSKRLKNYPEVDYVLDKYGADAFRYYMISSPAVRAEDFAFSEKGIDEVVKKVLMRLGNVVSFYEMYKSGEDIEANTNSKNILDKWIIEKVKQATFEMTSEMDKYKLDKSSKVIADFVEDLSVWYLRRSRDRFKSDNKTEREESMGTMRFVLVEFSKLIAPFMPFVAEEIYQKVKGKKSEESVHLDSWPKVKKVGQKILKEMESVRKIVSLGLEARAKAVIKVRQPLRELKVKNSDLKGKDELIELIKDEVNILEISFDESLEGEVSLDTNITPELREAGMVREFIRAVQDLRKTMKLNPSESVVLKVDTNEKGKEILGKFKDQISKIALLKEIEFKENDGGEIKIEEIIFKIKI